MERLSPSRSVLGGPVCGRPIEKGKNRSNCCNSSVFDLGCTYSTCCFAYSSVYAVPTFPSESICVQVKIVPSFSRSAESRRNVSTLTVISEQQQQQQHMGDWIYVLLRIGYLAKHDFITMGVRVVEMGGKKMYEGNITI